MGGELKTQMDGNLVLEGYDRAKFTGMNFITAIRRDLDCQTGMVASLGSMDVGFRDGTSTNIFSSPTDFCLDTSGQLVTLPNSLFPKLVKAVGGTRIGESSGFNLTGQLYDIEDL